MKRLLLSLLSSKRLLSLLAVPTLAVTAGVVFAYWTTHGTGSASATVATLSAPTNVIASSTLGASNMLACGQPNIPIGYQSVFAWYAGVKTGVLYVSAGYLKAHPHPLVNIYPIAGGWKVFPSHVDAAHAAACHRMRLVLRR